jgi:protein phosphatase
MSEVSISGPPVILFAEECDPGILRKENQNSVLHVHIALGDLLIVADGVGDEGGATASRMVVEEFYTHLAALPRDYPVRNAIREATARTNEKILAATKAPDAPYACMGSTVVLALIQQEAAGTNAWISHIGDSRAYLVRAGRMQCLTIDHSAAQVLLSRNLITPEEAQHHPDSTVLTRSLGHQPEVEIDIEELPLASGDTLLLCSDGLWGFVPERDIHRVAETLDLTVEAAAHNLLELALAAGGHDNVGIEMARLIPPPDAPPPRSENYLALKIVLTMLLIAVAAVCVLAYLTFWYY